MHLRWVRALVAVVLVATFGGAPHPAASAAAAEQLTIDEIIARRPVSGTPPAQFAWAPDGSRYAYQLPGKRAQDPPVVFVHDMRTGRDRELLAARAVARGTRSREIGQLVWSPDARRVAYVNDGALTVAPADGAGARVVARDADDPQWSPDGTRLAYVRDGDLHVVDAASGRDARVTRGGSDAVLNGDPDWLYSEELDVAHAYAWSPDGGAIAFLRFDDAPVTDFPIQNYLARDNTVEHQRYPLAGEKNPRVSLRVADLRAGTVRTLYDGARRDEYVLAPAWIEQGRALAFEILDRAQRRLRLVRVARAGGALATIAADADRRFVDVSPAPRPLRDGRTLLWLSDRGGVRALYRLDARTGAMRRLTGAYPVAAVLQVDEARGAAYVSARYPSRRERALLRVPLDGGPVRDLTPERGTHLVVMPERGESAIDAWSALNRPPVVVRRDVRTGASATIFRTPSLGRYALGVARAVELPSRWGPLDATVIVPPHADPARRYPVVVAAYGGPLPVGAGLPSDDRWPGLYAELLAERGFVVVDVDGPASRPDRADERRFAGSMGAIASAGPLAAAAWLRTQPFADPARLGLWGWSYGGYLTAYTLTHAPDAFRAGIAVAPVTDWRFYDSAYTERYLGSPAANRAAYARTSVLPAARDLRASLLVMQGAADDNVHLANSLALLDACIRAGKQVDFFLYPGGRHGISGVAPQRYVYAKMLGFWERTLR